MLGLQEVSAWRGGGPSWPHIAHGHQLVQGRLAEVSGGPLDSVDAGVKEAPTGCHLETYGQEGGPQRGGAGTRLGGTSGGHRTRTSPGVHLGDEDIGFASGGLATGLGTQDVRRGLIGGGGGDTDLALGNLTGDKSHGAAVLPGPHRGDERHWPCFGIGSHLGLGVGTRRPRPLPSPQGLAGGQYLLEGLGTPPSPGLGGGTGWRNLWTKAGRRVGS